MLLLSLCRRAALALLFTLPLGAAAASDAPVARAPTSTSAQVPIAGFFANSDFAGAYLSPSGNYLAAKTKGPGGRLALVVIDLATNAVKPLASYGNADINRVIWLNEERLAFDLTDLDKAPGERRQAPGLFAVNRDGTNMRQLAERRRDSVNGMPGAGRRILPPQAMMLGNLVKPDAPEHPERPDRTGRAPGTGGLVDARPPG